MITLFKSRPKKKPKAVIIYLVRSLKKDVKNLIKSLGLLKAHFLDKYPYPVIVFIEDSFKEEWKEQVVSETNIVIQFEQVKFEIPYFLNKSKIPDYVGSCSHGIGYRHMCRFFSGTVFQHPALRMYNWYWRLDSDSFILGKINYDIFQYMERKDYLYGYNYLTKDCPTVIVSLWKSVKKYIQQNRIKPTFLHKCLKNGKWNESIYYTNFEISKLDFWRSDKYAHFFNYLDRLGGIYKYRWGDAPIHTLAVSMFLPETKVYQFKDIAYKHQTFVC